MLEIFQETHLNNHGYEKNCNYINTSFTRVCFVCEREP